MAQVRFYSMQLDAEYLRKIIAQYNNDTEFKYLVFQQINPDSHANRDEYDLVGYIVGENWSVTKKFDSTKLTRDSDNSPLKISDKKVAFANYPVTRTRLNDYVNGAGGGVVEYLLLKPKEYIHDTRYVAYEIISINEKPYNSVEKNISMSSLSVSATGDDDANPCPPNQPGDS